MLFPLTTTRFSRDIEDWAVLGVVEANGARVSGMWLTANTILSSLVGMTELAQNVRSNAVVCLPARRSNPTTTARNP